MQAPRKEILIIDDDIDTINLIIKLFNNIGVDVIYANSFKEGLVAIKKNTPHLIMIDINLENEDGLEILKQARDNKIHRHTPILMISSDASKTNVFHSVAHGASDFIAKPLSSNILIPKVKKLLREFEIPTYKFKNKEKVVAEFEARIIKINEISFILSSSIKMNPDTNIKVKSNFLKKLGASKCKLKTITEGRIIHPGVYHCSVSLLGMDEKIAQKIRKIKKV